VQGYEVTRNGESLGVQDRLSIFVDDLSAGGAEVWTVTAVDFEGERSESVALEFVVGAANSSTSTVSTESGEVAETTTGIEVTGNTISLPDDGYYQVQTADGSSTICEGERTCTVEPGTYLVINLTLGLRFNGITVGSPVVSNPVDVDDAGITVTGTTISLPNDGYYQVQTADGSSTICEGERTCTVEPGTYLVINLTAGLRFNGITVGGQTDSGSTAAPEAVGNGFTVMGNTIVLLDDDYYQVQTANGGTTVCEGETTCTVEPGTYLVINLTSGQRFDGVVIPAASVEQVLDARISEGLDTLFDLLNGGNFLRQAYSAIAILTEAESLGFQLLGPTTVTGLDGMLDSNGIPQFQVFGANQFACPEGGEVAVSNGPLSDVLPDSSVGSLTVANATDCGFDDVVVSGIFEFGSNEAGLQSTELSNLEITSSGDDAARTTISSSFMVLNTSDNQVISQRWNVAFLSSQFEGRELAADSITQNFGIAVNDAIGITDIFASGIVSSALDGEVRVETIEPLNSIGAIDPGEPLTGRFTVISEEIQWEIDADGGDPSGFLLTRDLDNTRTSDLIPWSSTRRFDLLDISQPDLSFR